MARFVPTAHRFVRDENDDLESLIIQTGDTQLKTEADITLLPDNGPGEPPLVGIGINPNGSPITAVVLTIPAAVAFLEEALAKIKEMQP